MANLHATSHDGNATEYLRLRTRLNCLNSDGNGCDSPQSGEALDHDSIGGDKIENGFRLFLICQEATSITVEAQREGVGKGLHFTASVDQEEMCRVFRKVSSNVLQRSALARNEDIA